MPTGAIDDLSKVAGKTLPAQFLDEPSSIRTISNCSRGPCYTSRGGTPVASWRQSAGLLDPCRSRISQLTPYAKAIAEFDRLGRDVFLSTNGFGKARDYFLIYNGQPYDSKAIAGIAHRYLPGGVALKSNEFSGGDNAAAGRLRELGFDIKGPDEQLANSPHFRARWDL